MKMYRGFRLGRRLSLMWRWAFRRCRHRRRVKRCLRVDLADDSPARYYQSATMTTRLLGWTRRLARRLRRGGRYRGLEEGRWLLDDEEEWKKPPPKGFMAVYVGEKKEDADDGWGTTRRRYLVPVIYFNHPLFGELLREAEEEFGFHHPDGITIPCPADEFERVRTRIAAGGGSVRWTWKRAK